MIQRRTVDLLPEIFRTETNKQFLGATLDQLTQEPSVKRTQGYVGRRVGPGVNPADNYVVESTAARQDYQLEPGVVFFAPETQRALDAITYPGMIDALDLQGANTQRQDRLFESQYYTWDPFCDLDKFTNYSQYYWLPQGPDSVDVGSTVIPLTDDFDVSRTATAYALSGQTGNNPAIMLVRGGNYTFNVNQTGHSFWIQAAVSIDGTMPATPNISSRDVLGVINNGEDQGAITFNVPLKTAQDFYFSLTKFDVDNSTQVDLLTNLKFNQLNNVYVDQFLAQNPSGIDGITNLDGRTVVFTNTIVDAEAGGWQETTQFDSATNTFSTLPYDLTTDIEPQSVRYSLWRIQYVYDNDGRAFMRLTSPIEIPNLYKFTVLFGDQWASTQWYKNASSYFEQIPLLTAVMDMLYYRDGTNPEIFGIIHLVDQPENNPINIDDIIGAKNYTSPNGVVFTNGLKVQFRGAILPTRYQNLEFYVEGVGTGLGIDARVGFVDGEAYFGAFHHHNGQKLTGSTHDETVFQQYIYDTCEDSIVNQGRGYPEGAPLPTQGVLNATQGNGIKLLLNSNFVTPETYTTDASVPYDFTSYDSTPYDGALNSPLVPDYLTINRASRDLNPWTRSNRWFHRQVIEASAAYNNQTPIFNNDLRAKRPIIEFRSNIDLFNFGTQGKQPINIIDFQETDAFSNINGTVGYSIDGYTFIQGSRVIFAADQDPEIRNRIYEVEFIDPTNSGTKIINLVPAFNSQALLNQTVVVLSGVTLQGKSYWYDGVEWVLAQQKTSVNQAPLFDVYDPEGFSFSNRAVYPSSTFAGTKLFGYALGTTEINDTILGFPLRYLNISNVGDIVFENYLYSDTFLYVVDAVSQKVNISTGYIRQYIDRTLFSDLIGWQRAAVENRSRQVFRFTYSNEPLILDVPVVNTTLFPPAQIYAGTEFIDPTRYTLVVTETSTIIDLSTANIPNDTIIEVQALSNVASTVGFYQIPLNLSNNPLNENSPTFTLGTIRQHYSSIGENLRTITGPIIGPNNTRDLGNILPYGTDIVQHSSPLALAGVFLRERQYEVVSAIEFNSREYQKFKALMMDLASRGDFINNTPSQVLDSVILEIGLGRDSISPFYWSDMLPSGQNYQETQYTVTPITTPTFDTFYTYDFTSSNFQGLLVYLNGNILTKNYDYTVALNAPTFTILVPLNVGDVVTIREFQQTYGSYVPNTPTKMGLYPAYKPEMYLDSSYLNTTMVIRGHDGSITVAYGDYRDQVLLEFETRIFNNLKVQDPAPITVDEIIPGAFRTTDYTLQEINDILVPDFLSWAGWNKLDYTSQIYLAGNPFTFNYSQSSSKITGAPSLGAWRGIYNYFYDTVNPGMTPWEMLGFSQQPSWWTDTYGPAPYTSGNWVLWEDLEAGLVRDPNGPYVLPEYRRPGLMSVIPTGTEGGLLPPIETTIKNYDATSFRRSWAFGDGGPVEYTWRASSAWPFAVMRLMALTKPAKFFSLFADRDRYKFDADIDQYLWDQRYRLNAQKLSPIYGNGTSKASYINWIVDYNRQLGLNSTNRLTDRLGHIGVRLMWRLGAFSDKRYLQLYTERSTPNSLNTSLLLPDESYQLLLYRDQPFNQAAFSSVIVQITDDNRYQVYGYSTTRPYFEILSSIPNGNLQSIAAGGRTARVPIDHSDVIVQVPYGYVFNNVNAVCDFLISYGLLLEQRGFAFTLYENGYTLNWHQMAQEFLYWSNQGWAPGSLINLNPGAVVISVEQTNSVVDSLNTLRPENLILNQNRQPLPTRDLVIERIENKFTARSLVTNNTINYLNVSFTAFEHLVILDNTSIFADLIYDPITGARQSRILCSGMLSGDWNGTVNAPGFVINENNISEWAPNRVYTKGEIVLFKNQYWSASTIIQPGKEFNYNLWLKSDYNEVITGLLPNSPNASDQLATAYSIYDANLESETDLFAYGLIGFRPREYMQALNLDPISQVNLYQQFIGTKGTVKSAELFTFANLGKELGQYNIYEYWAMLKSQYGATANRNYIELLLDESKLLSDPSIIQVIEPRQESVADQTVQLQNVWKTSQVLTSTNILPTILHTPADASLPSAGYVNLNDVDYTIFDFREFATTLNPEVAEIGVGTTIWVAKSNAYDWNVYRVEEIPATLISISDNLEGASLAEFNMPHGLSVGDQLIIRFFNPSIDGCYTVLSAPSIFSLTIAYTFVGDQDIITGRGICFTLQTARVKQSADIKRLPYSLSLLPGAKAWVDNNGTGRWAVLEKTNPYTIGQLIPASEQIPGSLFGSSVAQSQNNLSAMIGAPGYNPNELSSAPGAVYTYIKNDANDYQENSLMSLTTDDTVGFGASMSMAASDWAVVGASASKSNQGYALVVYNPESGNGFFNWQLLYQDLGSSNDEFGYSVSSSTDGRWIYVGAPGANKVYAYGRIDVELQTVSYTGDGSTLVFNYGDVIKVTTTDQIAVVVNGVLQVLNTDYNANTNSILFSIAPAANSQIVFVRITNLTYAGTGSPSYSILRLYGYTDEYSVSVYVNDIIQRPVEDYTISGSTLTFTTLTPTSADSIVIRCDTRYQQVAEITASGLPSNARFGHSVHTSTDGRQLIIGTPNDDITSGLTFYNQAGSAFVCDRSVQRFEITNPSITNYTTQQTLPAQPAPVNVLLNGVFLINSYGNNNGQYSISGNTITLTVPLAVGDILEIESTEFVQVQKITDPNLYAAGKFGWATDLCTNNCSLYISAPYDGSVQPEAGHVVYFTNQSRVYGSITSGVANPNLTYGQYIRIDDYFVEFATPSTWTSLTSWSVNSIVINTTDLYRALRPVPPGTALTDVTYWQAINKSTALKYKIDAAAIPNVLTTLTADAEFVGDAQTTEFFVGNLYSAADSYTPLVYVNNVIATGYTYDAATETITFTTAPSVGALIRVLGARLTVAVKNRAAVAARNLVNVSPVVGSTIFSDLGFDTNVFAYSQTIDSPRPQQYSHFGKAIFISTSADTLVVGAPDATAIFPTTFDNNTTTFDSNSTNFADISNRSGAVYTFDALSAVNASIDNPRQFLFGQQLYDIDIGPLDQFGAALDYTTGMLLAGSPGEDFGDSSANYGRVVKFENPTKSPAWVPIRTQQEVVNINLLNTVFMYDRVSGKPKQYFDFFDPLQGRLLGSVAQNLDYIGAVDPAAYNVGTVNNYGQKWSYDRIGQIWWDTSDARFIDPNQDDPVYASRRWGQLFPGSTVRIYQWVSSNVPPSQYTGPGTVRNVDSYVVVSAVDEQGLFSTVYFFWAADIRTVNKTARKTLSIETLKRYIEEPKSSGISYIAPINASTIAMYNGLPYITAFDTIIHVEFDELANDDPVHVEYQLIAQDRKDGFLNDSLYRKLQDSFCGVDTVGNLVPDPKLPPSERYGVAFRPRQSMFTNRFLALKNYLTYANEIIAQFPVVETKYTPLLNSEEPEPTVASDAYNMKVANLAELSYQNLATVPVGYRYLVVNDSSNNGLWTIYEVQVGVSPTGKLLGLIRVQNYDTKLYWSYTNWYKVGYSSTTLISAEVPSYSALGTLTLPEGSSVKVTSNGQGKWEIYQLDGTRWERVALQDGTIQFSEELWDYTIGRFGFDVEVFDAQYFDKEPVIETRKIIQSINQEIFIEDLAIYRNRALILMFNYILSEQTAPTWLLKTSLIDVDHTIRQLVPFQIYRRDNQDFVLNYIKEVKPYHTQIRQFNLIYQGDDLYQGNMTDFDVPAYWDAEKGMFISPVLDNGPPLVPPMSTTSSVPSTDPIWQTFPWNQWFENYTLSVESVTLVSGGAGYIVPPVVTITGVCTEPAEMTAQINSAGRVVAINVINPGSGYTTTAIITLSGGGLPEATSWLPGAFIYVGSFVITEQRNIYSVLNSGNLGQVAPTHTSGISLNGDVNLSYIGTNAYAVAVMGNGLVRNFDITLKYDRYSYNSSIAEWQANVTYVADELVRHDNRVWRALATVSNTIFDFSQWQLVPAGELEATDRIMGYYTPEPSMPGLDLSLLLTGIDYPGVQVTGPAFSQNTGFDVGNYDINPFDNISYGPEGRPTYDPAILDAIYESEFTDPYLGTLPAPAYDGAPPDDLGPNPIVVNGGEFIDTYESHAPEELVPGAIFDTLDIRVFTTPGSDWTEDGHGFDIRTIAYEYEVGVEYSYASLVDFPVQVMVWNQSNGVQLLLNVNYTVDWVAQTVTVTSGIAAGNVLVVEAFGVGGGNQMYRNAYDGDEISDTVVVPIKSNLIQGFVVFVNGEVVTNYTYASYLVYNTRIEFTAPWTATDRVTVIALGYTTTGTHSWSTPITQYVIADGINLAYTLTNSLVGTNPANIIVEKNGIRARPAEGVRYTTPALTYELPLRGGYNQGTIANNEVQVYINNTPLVLGVGYVVEPYIIGYPRTVTLTSLPAVGDEVLISVSTAADYYFSGNTLIWKPSSPLMPLAGDVLSFTTWNDTSEQQLLTQVFVGPTIVGTQISEGYDTADFDSANVDDTPGSYDFAIGSIIQVNEFDTGRNITDADRLIVTLNGQFLFENVNFSLNNGVVTIFGPPISASAVVVITSMTPSVLPSSIAFRIFQDMRGAQTSYRITPNSTAILMQNLSAEGDVIYVDDAGKLAEPNLVEGLFGQVTINGERIFYRTRNLANNTLSGLRRGTLGTGAAEHIAGTPVYDIGIGNMIPLEYQNYIQAYQEIQSNTAPTTTFIALDITVTESSPEDYIQVFVGGYLQTSGYTVTSASPVTIVFDTAPPSGVEVTIQVYRGYSWYAPGGGIPLQEADTLAARFIRGE